MDTVEPAPANPVEQPPRRRGFLKAVAAVVIGGVITAVPAAAGLLTFFDPVRRKRPGNGNGGKGFINVAPLSALPADGVPRRFPVLAERTDAWNKHPASVIGAVYLKRPSDAPDQVTAFNVLCPHAKCFVEAQPGPRGGFLCPCHNSTFNPDGSRGKVCVSARGLDELAVDADALKVGTVKVKFQNFVPGTHEKIPVG
jgi:Rieske Fe-S protein